MTTKTKTDVRMSPNGCLYLCEDGEPMRLLQPGADDVMIDAYELGPDLKEIPED